MMSMLKRFVNPALLLILLAGLSCDSFVEMPEPVELEELLVLNATLVAGFPIDSVRLNVAASIEDAYDHRSTALRGATVVLRYLSNADTLSEHINQAGVYYHPDPEFTVENGVTYTIEASDGEHPAISASTTVPDNVEMFDMNPMINSGDSIRYIPAGEDAQFLDPYLFSFSIRAVADGEYPPMVRVVNIALDAREETMVMEDDTLKAFLFKWEGIGYEDPEDIEMRLRKNAVSFNSVEQGGEVQMGWIFYRFYGPQVLLVYSIDQAYYDYHVRNLEGPPADPNYIPRSNVTGGYGLLSSASLNQSSMLYYYLLRP